MPSGSYISYKTLKKRKNSKLFIEGISTQVSIT